MIITDNNKYDYGRMIIETKKPLSYLIEQNPNVRKIDRGKELAAVQNDYINKANYSLRKWANLVYLAMIKLNVINTRLQIDYCRNYYRIPTNSGTDILNMIRMNKEMDALDLQNNRLSGEEYLQRIKSFSFELAGKIYTMHNLTELNEFFYLLEINLRIFATHDDCGIRFIFGEVSLNEVNGFYEYSVGKEIVRTVGWPLAIVSEIVNGNGTIVRREGCEVIKNCKWNSKPSKEEMAQALCHPYSAISQGFIDKTLHFYHANLKKNKIKENQNNFIDTIMLPSVLTHERSHIKSFSDMNTVARNFRAIFASDEGDTAGCVLLEAMADFSGFFDYIFEIAVHNKKLGLALVYCFCSDSWFLSKNSNQKQLLSFVQVSLALHFLNTAGNDFRFLDEDETIDLSKMKKERERIYYALLNAYQNLVEDLIEVMKHANFLVPCADNSIVELDFDELHEMVAYQLYDLGEDSNQDLFEESSFWINMVGYLKQWSEDGWKNYQAVLKQAEITLENLVLMLINSSVNNEGEENERW